MQTNPTRLLLLAAKSGDAAAQFHLTVLCDNRLDENGYPIEGNRTGAMKWLLAAAEQGLPRAQSKLAEMYTDGPAAPEDDIDAVSGSLSRQRTWPESTAIEPNPDTSAFPRV